MIDFQNPGTQAIIQSIVAIVTSVATVALTWLTSRYVRLTGSMLEEARLSRGPNIYLDLELRNRNDFRLVVGNSGASPAHDLRFEVTDSIPWVQFPGCSNGFKTLDVVIHGISYIAPGRSLKYEVGAVDWREMAKVKSGEIAEAIKRVNDNPFLRDKSFNYYNQD